jgi:hypothetical protein
MDHLGKDGLAVITLQDPLVRYSPEQLRIRYATVIWSIVTPLAVLAGWIYYDYAIEPATPVNWAPEVSEDDGMTERLGGFLAFLVIAPIIGFFSVLLDLFIWLSAIVIALGVSGLIVYLFVLAIYIVEPLFASQKGKRDEMHRLERALRRISKNKLVRGTEVFRIADSNWREAVRSALKFSDAVVIDISEITEHIEWEISAAESDKGRKGLVFIQRADARFKSPLTDVPIVCYSSTSRRYDDAFSEKLLESLYDAVDRQRTLTESVQ